jgi:hypothetical protein
VFLSVARVQVHIQWTGSSPQGGEGEGNNGDRSNLLLMRGRQYSEAGQAPELEPHVGQWGRAYPALINDTTLPRFLGLDFQRLRMLALNGLKSSHFDIGPLQATVAGEFRYMCSRNNAFCQYNTARHSTHASTDAHAQCDWTDSLRSTQTRSARWLTAQC